MDFESNGCAFESRQAHRRDILMKGEIEKIKEGEERAQPKGYGEVCFSIASSVFVVGVSSGKGKHPCPGSGSDGCAFPPKSTADRSAKKYGGQASRARRAEEIY